MFNHKGANGGCGELAVGKGRKWGSSNLGEKQTKGGRSKLGGGGLMVKVNWKGGGGEVNWRSKNSEYKKLKVYINVNVKYKIFET